MTESVCADLEEGRISEASSKTTCIHTLGAVPKSNGGYHTITDCSMPKGESVNNYSDTLAPKFKFETLDYVTDRLEEGAYMSVIDIKSAYRAVSVNPDHWEFQGFRWELDGEEHTYIDHRLCFGGRTAPYYFNLISDFIHRVLSEREGLNIMNYMDDFLVWSNSSEGCLHAQSRVTKLLRYLGFYVAWNKVTSPSTVAQYLGNIISTGEMTLSIPTGKLSDLRELLSKYRQRNCISKKDLEKLTGLLAHCAQCVQGGRIFCHRLYNLYSRIVRAGQKKSQLGPLEKGDIEWWYNFAESLDGSSLIVNYDYPIPVFTDASKEGFAAVMGSDWVAGSWKEPLQLEDTEECHHGVPPHSLPART